MSFRGFVLALLVGFAGLVRADGWAWGQFYTPTRILVQPGYARVQFAEGTLNPSNCALTFPGVAIDENQVGGADNYKILLTLFFTAYQTHSKMELATFGCIDGGPGVTMATISQGQ